MTAHKLAHALLNMPDDPVVINGWGSDEGSMFEVDSSECVSSASFNGSSDTKDTPRDKMGRQLPRMCVQLGHCERTPISDDEIQSRREAEAKRIAIKANADQGAYRLMYWELKPLTPEDFVAMDNAENIKRI